MSNAIQIDGQRVLTVALVYGFKNIQNLIRKLKTSTSGYDFVEIMACPSGCVNGGGQLRCALTASIELCSYSGLHASAGN